MSEAVTNSEIEDVLSSIRRLVSEDISGETQSRLVETVAPVRANGNAGDPPARLVLTPAFRVAPVDELADALLVRSENLHLGVTEVPETLQEDHVQTADTSADEAASGASDSADLSESNTPLVDFEVEGDRRLLDFLSDEPLSIDDGASGPDSNNEDDPVLEAEAAQPNEHTDHTDEPALASEDAILEDSNQKNAGQQDASQDQAGQGADTAPLELTDPVAQESDENHTAPAADEIQSFATNVTDFGQNTGFETTEDVAQSALRLNSLEKTIADLEAVVSETDGEWEPDGSEVEGSMPEIEPLQWHRASANRTHEPTELPENWSDATPDPFKSQPRVDDAPLVDETYIGQAAATDGNAGFSVDDSVDNNSQNGADDDGSMFNETETVLDEEALRALVSDLVREELQGSLGERITRSVRKLVRREIQLALARKDFD